MSELNPLNRGNNKKEDTFSSEELLLIDKLKNQTYLPSTNDLEILFKLKERNKTNLSSQEKELSFIKQEDLFNKYVNGTGIFESTGAKFEIWTKEYIERFSSYLAERISNLSETKKVILLETAAGNGQLSYFLKEKLDEKIPGKFEIIATDHGNKNVNWNIKNLSHVELIDYKNAINKYHPDIILTSWMPLGEDFTQEYRDCPSVKEYILIGDLACTGDQLKTWGENPYDDEWIPAYKKDGFKQISYQEDKFINGIGKYQRNRSSNWDSGHSDTSIFRRMDLIK